MVTPVPPEAVLRAYLNAVLSVVGEKRSSVSPLCRGRGESETDNRPWKS